MAESYALTLVLPHYSKLFFLLKSCLKLNKKEQVIPRTHFPHCLASAPSLYLDLLPSSLPLGPALQQYRGPVLRPERVENYAAGSEAGDAQSQKGVR